MKLANPAILLAGLSLAAAGDLHVKRWDYDVCLNDCTLAGVAMPDQDTFQLPLENFWSEQCPPIILGPPNAPVATSKVCLTFVGTALRFTFAPFSGFNMQSAAVNWKVKGNLDNPGGFTGASPLTGLECSSASSGGGFVCDLPFSDILQVPGTTSKTGLLWGMCPNGDREALDFYLAFSGWAKPVGGGSSLHFQQEPPCKTRAPNGSCIACATSPMDFIEVAYRCTKCNVNPCPTSCTCGTAFGYEEPCDGVQKSFPLSTQPGEGCNIWGWYSTPTLAELQSQQGISGPLYVGAGGGDISQAVQVGVWCAKANGGGGVTVDYQVTPPYVLVGAHIDLDCLPIETCVECTYDSGLLANQASFSNPGPIAYPSCPDGSRVALVVHADVNLMTASTTCPPPVTTT
jgi:hypothetical protein